MQNIKIITFFLLILLFLLAACQQNKTASSSKIYISTISSITAAENFTIPLIVTVDETDKAITEVEIALVKQDGTRIDYNYLDFTAAVSIRTNLCNNQNTILPWDGPLKITATNDSGYGRIGARALITVGVKGEGDANTNVAADTITVSNAHWYMYDLDQGELFSAMISGNDGNNIDLNLYNLDGQWLTNDDPAADLLTYSVTNSSFYWLQVSTTVSNYAVDYILYPLIETNS
ncbi:MAG TPA: hypothetical protein VKS21_00185 [Spirochaetota bacterium]|nr:hypothetical protein [Spirochaetota bacterium]